MSQDRSKVKFAGYSVGMMAAPQDRPWLWQYIDRDLFADPAQVHVWQIPLDVDDERLAALTQTLSPDEPVRADRFLSPVDRARFVAGRGSVRAVLAGYLNTAPEALRFTYSLHGKPELSGDPRLHFNLTRCEDLALLAVSAGGPVGIDLERLRMDFAPEPLAARFFAPSEREALEQASPAEKHRVYWAIWTAKEACLKALGTGLDTPLNSFAVSLDAAHTLSAPLRLLPLSPAPDFVAAVAAPIKDVPPACHNPQ